MKKTILIVIITSMIISSIIMAQSKPTLHWFGYVRSNYKYTINEDSADNNQFDVLVTLLGLKAQINKYSSVFIDFYFNYNSVNSLEGLVPSYTDMCGVLDASVSLEPIDGLSLTMGQFVTPYSSENLKSASKIDFINRGYTVRISPAYRDIGAYAKYRSNLFSLYAGVVNGSGMNTGDNNNDKNLVARAEVRPIDGLGISAATSVGKDNHSASDDIENQNYYTGGISYKISDVEFAAEYSLQDYMDNSNVAMYAYGLYDFKLDNKFIKHIIPAVRYDFHDPDGDDNKEDRITAGLGISFHENKWLSLLRINYEIVTSESDQLEPADNLIIELQMRFE